ncbi:MAG: CoA transferase [Alphaproteobacteria bacterium]|nr:CoA transferase [Alphaproteobacteria bacterium]MBU0793385.1 CoA transferase [Alphaproteobacteria bacterium]MBU0877024.1 CoA transferase [Alphaproteobacteria bacterium]MBU1768450.1 CoA transferase [Alphaproteobacteria bacterium]
MNQPLKGIRIADFSHVMAGPFASHLLRLMGAEVIKIEPRRGDQFRSYGGDRRYDGMSPAFIAANAGKKSIALDLKDPDELAIARGIIARSDVLLENFRPGVITRLGLGYEDVRKLRPDIVFCSVSGYGQTGPQRDWPAIDNIVQATSGMMMLSGGEGDEPVRVGFPIVDTLTGQSAALAILSALFQRERTGQGAYIDVSMFDASLAFMTSALTPFLVTGQAMKRMGNTGYSGLPTASLFKTKDGREISLGVVQANQFDALAREVGREDWLQDVRFATPEARRENFDAMSHELEAVFVQRDAADWERDLSNAGIPCGMIRRVNEAVDLAGPEALIEMAIPGIPQAGQVAIPNVGFRMTPGSPGTTEPPPRLDEHREEILKWLAGDGRG